MRKRNWPIGSKLEEEPAAAPGNSVVIISNLRSWLANTIGDRWRSLTKRQKDIDFCTSWLSGRIKMLMPFRLHILESNSEKQKKKG